jgi:electron transport complex protein RnfG
MGTVFVITDRSKKQNEHNNFQETMLGLLGYNKQKPAPSDLELYPVYRYIIEEKGVTYLGYMVPVKNADGKAYDLLMLTLEGALAKRFPLNISLEKAVTAAERQNALQKVFTASQNVTYQDQTIVARQGQNRVAYLLPGEFPGFKTFIKVMLALNPKFDIIGLEIMEHEEDPGLGAEIKQNYFKNQFKNKSFERLKDLDVVKEPLPEAYRPYLEAPETLTPAQIETIRTQYQDKNIYALTGATISSRSVTNGVKNMVKRFAYRIKILDDVIAKEQIPAVI